MIVTITTAVIGLLIVVFLILYFRKESERPAPAPAFPKPLTLANNALLAKAAIVYDPTTGKILYAKNASATLPLASLTKLMTAQVVLSALPPTKLITLSAKDVSVEGDAGDWNLQAGDTMTLSNIIKLGLDASSNHAMSAAAAALGAQDINDLNKTAAQLGLSHSYFLNATGLDLTSDTSGAYGSASDVAHLAADFMRDYPSYFELSTEQSVTVPVSANDINREVTVDATALPILNIPGLIGAKTGYTDLAGGNLVVAFDLDIGHPVIAVVLGSTEDGRFSDIRTLIDASRAAQE